MDLIVVDGIMSCMHVIHDMHMCTFSVFEINMGLKVAFPFGQVGAEGAPESRLLSALVLLVVVEAFIVLVLLATFTREFLVFVCEDKTSCGLAIISEEENSA